MHLLQQLKSTPFYIRLTNWEYWPSYIFNIPIIFMWLYFALRARALFFFSAVNPAIENGGVLGESKINILNRIPQQYLPKTLFVEAATGRIEQLLNWMEAQSLTFPIIAKPNVGERGFLVKKLENRLELEQYLSSYPIDFLLQEYISYPLELSISYYHFPDSREGHLTSVCIKEHLEVTGDGVSSLKELILDYPRAKLQWETLEKKFADRLGEMPGKGEEVLLVPIGNHCKGSKFLNGNAHISPQLTEVFNKIGQQMKDIHFGRFDLKCNSFEELEQGDNFKILEFNGVAAEPAHIYHPGYALFQAYKDYFKQWKIIYEISKEQRKLGAPVMTFSEAISQLRDYMKYMRRLKAVQELQPSVA